MRDDQRGKEAVNHVDSAREHTIDRLCDLTERLIDVSRVL